MPLVLPLGSAAAYLLLQRRRLEHRGHRLFGDVTLALILAFGAYAAFNTALILARGWGPLSAELGQLREACWPR